MVVDNLRLPPNARRRNALEFTVLNVFFFSFQNWRVDDDANVDGG